MLDYKPSRKNPDNRRSLRRARRGKQAPARAKPPQSPPPAPPAAERTEKRTEKHTVQPWRPRLAATLLTTAKALCALLAAWLVLGLGVETVALWRSPLAKVEFSGNRSISVETLVEAGGLAAGQPLGGVDPFTAAVRLGRLARVEAADVRRIFPGRVVVAVREREPAAVVYTAAEVRAVVDRQGMVLALFPAELPERWRGLPRIRYSVGNPVVGRRLAGAEPRRALDLLAHSADLGLKPGETYVINVDDPFAIVLALPERNQRVILPPDGLERALMTYRALAPSLPARSQKVQILDLRMIGPTHGGRIIIRR